MQPQNYYSLTNPPIPKVNQSVGGFPQHIVNRNNSIPMQSMSVNNRNVDVIASRNNNIQQQTMQSINPRGGISVPIAPRGYNNIVQQQNNNQVVVPNYMGPNPMVQSNENTPRFDQNDFPALGSDNSDSSNINNPNEGPRFDQNDFPALGSQNSPQSNPKENGFIVHHDEFPALSTISQPSSRQIQNNIEKVQNQSHINTNSTSESSISHYAYTPGVTTSPRKQPNSSDESYSLMGLLNVIRMTDPDLNILALGTDLTTLGLNLDSQEALYPHLTNPWASSTVHDPEFVLPSCYQMHPPALKTSHLTKFKLETLFYIFYNMPKDALQVYAAKELYCRDWKYHKDLKIWFKSADSTPDSTKWAYFDINHWEKRLYSESSGQPLNFMEENELSV